MRCGRWLSRAVGLRLVTLNLGLVILTLGLVGRVTLKGWGGCGGDAVVGSRVDGVFVAVVVESRAGADHYWCWLL